MIGAAPAGDVVLAVERGAAADSGTERLVYQMQLTKPTPTSLLGVDLYRAPDGGVSIAMLDPSLPLSRAGARIGDVLMTIDGAQPTNAGHGKELLSRAPSLDLYLSRGTGTAPTAEQDTEVLIRL